jgi:hypothetical protein
MLLFPNPVSPYSNLPALALVPAGDQVVLLAILAETKFAFLVIENLP